MSKGTSLIDRWSQESNPIILSETSKVRRFIIRIKKQQDLDEKTYTVGDTQYWKRGGKAYSWTESGGKKEISDDEYYKALEGQVKNPANKIKKDLPKIKPSDYADMENENLVQYAQQGDEIAQERLILNYEPLIKKMSYKYFLDNDDRDELEQNAMIGVWEAIQTYDDSKGTLHKHITNTVDRKLKDVVRSANTNQAQANTYSSKLDGKIKGETDKTLGDVTPSKDLTPEEQYVGKEGAERLMKFINTELANKEKDAILRFINGMKITEIADDMDVSYKTVENAIMRARNKIRQFREEYMEEALKYQGDPILESLLENVFREIDENFDVDGFTYKSVLGTYYKDNKKISKKEYRLARKKYDALNNNHKGKCDPIDVKLSAESTKRVEEIKSNVNDYLEDAEIDYLSIPDNVDYAAHGRYNESVDSRVLMLSDELGIEEDESLRYVNSLKQYSSGNQLTDYDRRHLRKALSALPIYYEEDVRLYRGLSLGESKHNEILDALRNYTTDTILPLKRFTSFSSTLDIASSFAEHSGPSDEVKIIIVNTFNISGCSITQYSEYKEDEVLYDTDTKFTIRNVDDMGDIMVVHVEESNLTEDIESANEIDLDLEGPQRTE